MGRRNLALLVAFFLAIPSVALPQVQGVWDCFNMTCQDLKARAGDTLDASLADSTAACKTGTSAPGTCGVGQCFFDTDATAGSNLFGCTSTNTWTLLGDGSGITGSGSAGQVTYWSGTSAVTGEAAFAYDASSNELTVPEIDNGGSTSGANTLTLNDKLALYPAMTSYEARTDNDGIINWNPTWVPETDVTAGKLFLNVFRLGGVAQVGASQFTAPFLSMLRLDPVVDVVSTTNANTASTVYALWSQLENKLSTSGAAFSAVQTSFQDSSMATVATSSDGTLAAMYSHVDNTVAKTTSSGDVTVTSQATLVSAPQIVSAASTTATVTTRRGVWVKDVATSGDGTEAVGTQVGVDVEALSIATTDIGIRNASTSVFTPTSKTFSNTGVYGTTSEVFPTDSSLVMLNMTNASIAIPLGDGTNAMLDGQNGQCVKFVNAGSYDVYFTDRNICPYVSAGTCNGGGGCWFILNPKQGAEFCFSSTLSCWVQTSGDK